MKLSFLLFTFIWGSLSYRSPNIDNCERDYEIGFGIQNQYYMIDMFAERELGLYYRGGKLNIRPLDWIELDYLCKEARHIDSESIKLLYRPFRDWLFLHPIQIGASVNAQSWNNTRGLLALTYRTEHTQFSYETNFVDRLIISFKIGLDIPIGKNFVTQLFHKYESSDGKDFDQEKMVIGWKKEK